MKSKVYIETSVISYLTARPSRDVIVLAHQEMTRQWWEQRRQAFDIFTSPLVWLEASRGDVLAARQRLDVIEQITSVDEQPDTGKVARQLIAAARLPASALTDAAHVALAAQAGMDYLLTWNCKHIANAEIERALAKSLGGLGLVCPVLCTPGELMGVN